MSVSGLYGIPYKPETGPFPGIVVSEAWWFGGGRMSLAVSFRYRWTFILAGAVPLSSPLLCRDLACVDQPPIGLNVYWVGNSKMVR